MTEALSFLVLPKTDNDALGNWKREKHINKLLLSRWLVSISPRLMQNKPRPLYNEYEVLTVQPIYSTWLKKALYFFNES